MDTLPLFAALEEPAAKPRVAIIGAGPAGLMAAQTLAQAGMAVSVYDQKKSPARKFLIAGRGGLNLTHSEDANSFIGRYGPQGDFLKQAIDAFPPAALRAWCEELGEPTFTGSSGRVFPQSFKASPLLRAWLARLDKLGVTFHPAHQWTGWSDDNALRFIQNDSTEITVRADAVLLALGGASWPHLGSDGAWTSLLRDVPQSPLRPANCGFTVGWSDILRDKYAGHPIKSASFTLGDQTVNGEAMLTQAGIEGGAIYALSRPIRDAIERNGHAVMHMDLRRDISLPALTEKLSAARGRDSFTNFLRKAAGLSPVAIGLVQEHRAGASLPAAGLARLIKQYPVTLLAPFAIDRAISSAGGIHLDAINADYMLKQKAGVFIAGEMLDWEVPTGGYLLQACFSTGRRAAQGMLAWLKHASLQAPASAFHSDPA